PAVSNASPIFLYGNSPILSCIFPTAIGLILARRTSMPPLNGIERGNAGLAVPAPRLPVAPEHRKGLPMLKQRIMTAIVMLAILLAALFAPGPWPLVLLFTLIAACAQWEWLRLTWPRQGSALPAVLAVLLAALLLL